MSLFDYAQRPCFQFWTLLCAVVFRMTQQHCLEGQVYSVPLIQPDLRREEAVHQITDALLYLETISTDIFRRQAHTHTHKCIYKGKVGNGHWDSFGSVCVLYSYSCWCVYVCVASRVSDSVEKNRRQLQSITDRIRLAEARVNKIKGSKKATKVRQCRHLYILHM